MSVKTILIGLGRIAWSLEKDPLRYHPCTHAGSLIRTDSAGNRISSRPPGSPRNKNPFELAGVCDRNQEKMDRFLNWWKDPVSVAERDYRLLLERTRPDLVIIATSLPAHFEIARAAIKRGVGAIVLEKPITETVSEARALLQLARKHRIRIWVNFERRYHPGYRRVKKIVDGGELGKLRGIHGRVLTGPVGEIAPDSGPLLHDAVHWIDLLLWLIGRPEKIEARMIPSLVGGGVEDTAFLNLGYQDFNVFLESGGRRNYFEFFMQLDFEDGRVITGNEGQLLFRAKPSRRYRHFNELQPQRLKFMWKNPWVELYREIARELTLNQKGAEHDYPGTAGRITANLEDAVAGMEIIGKCHGRLDRIIRDH